MEMNFDTSIPRSSHVDSLYIFTSIFVTYSIIEYNAFLLIDDDFIASKSFPSRPSVPRPIFLLFPGKGRNT